VVDVALLVMDDTNWCVTTIHFNEYVWMQWHVWCSQHS
jgi:hypothetical protein